MKALTKATYKGFSNVPVPPPTTIDGVAAGDRHGHWRPKRDAERPHQWHARGSDRHAFTRGHGDVIEPEHPVMAIGSGGAYALAWFLRRQWL